MKASIAYPWLPLMVLVCLTAGACSLQDHKWDIHPDQARLDFRKDFLAQPTPAPKPGRPNVIIIMADDLGRGDLAHYGGTHVPTPHIDAIGTEGVTFEDGYISSPICSPSRAALLTGRYQQRFGHEYQPHDRYPRNALEYFVYQRFLDTRDWILTSDKSFPTVEAIAEQGLTMEEFTLAELMQRQGYATGIIGKWHLGTEEHCWPNKRGFDYQYGFYEAYSLYHPDTSHPDIINQHHTDFSDPYIWKGARKGNCALRCNHTIVEDSLYLTQRLALEACAFLRQHQQDPFFLYVPFSAPHTPFQAWRKYYDRFPSEHDRNKRVYLAMIASLDDAVGQIMDTLDALGLAENTMVWFLSDNGGATYTRAADNFPFKGGKFTNFEGGIRVPMLLRWTGHLPAGLRYRQPVISMDIFQTTVEQCGIALPQDRPYDGSNLLPYLSTDNQGEPHKSLFWRSNYTWAVRQGQWKLIVDGLSGNRVLYNLALDPSEAHNLHASSPDIVAMLEAAYKEWEAQMIQPKWQRVMEYRYETPEGDFYFPL